MNVAHWSDTVFLWWLRLLMAERACAVTDIHAWMERVHHETELEAAETQAAQARTHQHE
jgi:hypothetical protein